jgi:hypothetical protein
MLDPDGDLMACEVLPGEGTSATANPTTPETTTATATARAGSGGGVFESFALQDVLEDALGDRGAAAVASKTTQDHLVLRPSALLTNEALELELMLCRP